MRALLDALDMILFMIIFLAIYGVGCGIVALFQLTFWKIRDFFWFIEDKIYERKENDRTDSE